MEKLKQRYNEQVQNMATKSRFGFFSVLPSHTAGITDYSVSPCKKNDDGRVTTKERNIYSGASSSGVLKKSYFSIPKSVYQGDPYKDPQFISAKDRQQISQEREAFKPAKLNKTLNSSSYKYMCDKKPPKQPKQYRDQDGKVKIQGPNIFSSSLTKIQYQNLKKIRYIESPYDNLKNKIKKDMEESVRKRRGQGPFQSGNPVRQFFTTHFQSFNDHQLKKVKKLKSRKTETIISHEAQFKPSCRNDVGFKGLFSYPNHMSDKPKTAEKKKRKINEDNKVQKEPFKLLKRPASTKPCPSITYMSCTKKMR